MSAAFVIGIDLGTTNSVVAFCPLDAEDCQTELLPIPQVVAAGTIEEHAQLPSFLYLPTEEEQSSGSYALPFETDAGMVTGRFARTQSAAVPDRSVAAAKSWLCHSQVDRTAPILPWQADADIPKVSPVTASCAYLRHIRSAWDAAHSEHPLHEQQVVLTVPASFDAAARELTREAAIEAGLPDDLILLEEPQATVYAWLESVGDDWRSELTVDDQLLVVDVGGGTTDLTLVRIIEEEGDLHLERTAVGDHLLVGGDNMDLALAHHVAGLFAEKNITLDPWQSVSLWHSCREAKEALLAEDGPETHSISVLGRGSKLIGGTVSVDVNASDARKLLTEGFFPECDRTAVPVRARMSGFQEIGLPFESDAGITKHVAAFLARQVEQTGADVTPTHVLFNGGVFRSPALSDRLLNILGSWYSDSEPKRLTSGEDLDYAVAKGAAFYGWSKQRGGIRIRGGTARSYYVGIETAGLAIPGAPRPLRALCVVPQGMEEGTETAVPGSPIGLVIGEPARFRFFSSNTRADDQPGNTLATWSEDELTETDPLEATLDRQGDSDDPFVPVTFESRITELGMFELWCVQSGEAAEGDHRWKLEFNVREDAGAEA